MDYEVNWVHLKILVGFLLVSVLFGYAFYSDYVGNYEDNSLVGYVVFDSGTKVSTDKLSPELVQEIQSGNDEPKIVVVLEDTAKTTASDLEQRKEAIREVQEEVISDLEDKVEVLNPKEAPSQPINADLEITQEFDTVNAFAGEVKSAEALLELTQNKKVKRILLDYPVEASLDQSASRINAPSVWDFSINNNSIDGSGETICIVDTGIDYTHPALGSCNPVTYQLSGTIANLSGSVESAHPYTDSMDYTWKINVSGYTNIAIHLTNFSLEAMPSGGDTTDRIYVYDQNNNTLAIYKESAADVWTPHGEGDTIYIRLVSDGSVIDYGFYIDQVINGTTNTTMNWSSCPKVIGGWDTYNNDADPKDDHGHGTHVAGIAASADDTYRGVAPGANLIAIKALNSAGGGHSSDVVAGIDWCVQNANKFNISIISMSLGCSSWSCVHYQDYCNSDLTASVVAAAYAKNILVFIAAGNSGWTNGIANPACVQYAIPIGAADGNDVIVYNRGVLLNLLAPGTNINSAALNGGWASLSGTSMATPHAAGAAALLREYWKEVYGMSPTPTQVLSKFSATGKAIFDASGSGLNFSRIDVLGVVSPIINFTLEVPADGSISSANSLWINITSDVPLASAWVELTPVNSNSTNYTLINPNSSAFINSFHYNLTKLDNGTYTYKVYGNDGLTEAYTETRTITINYTPASAPPLLQLSVTFPANQSYHQNSFYLNLSLNTTNSSLANISSLAYNFTNSSGLTILSYSIDSLNAENYHLNRQINVPEDSPLNVNAIISEQNGSLSDGNYTLVITAYDTLGESISTQYILTVDTLMPSVFNVNHTPTLPYFNESLTFHANINDLNLNNSGILFKSNHSGNWSNYSMNQQNDSLFNYTIAADTFSTNTTIFYQMYAYDLAGNVNSSGILNVSVIYANDTSIHSNATSDTITSPINGTVIEVGNAALFNATTSLTGNLTYLWSFRDGTNATDLSVSKQYNVTGEYDVTLNISNSSVSSILNITIRVNDTLAPIITYVNYSTVMHLGKDKTQLVNATLFDYSNLSSVKLWYNDTIKTAVSSGNDTYTWNISQLDTGNNNSFIIEAIDNYTTLHAKNYTYNFTVTSCSDGIKNGDENQTDCGGSCSVCVANATNVTASAAEITETIDTTPATASLATSETTQTTENIIITSTTPGTALETTPATAAPVNWTTNLKASEISKRETALYILGGILIFLLAIYALILMRG